MIVLAVVVESIRWSYRGRHVVPRLHIGREAVVVVVVVAVNVDAALRGGRWRSDTTVVIR